MSILSEIFEATPIVKGGLTLMVAGWLGYQCRAIPERLWATLRHWSTREIEIRDKNPLYEAWLELLTETAIRPGGPRTVEVRSDDDEPGHRGSSASLKAGLATFWARPLGLWCRASISREEGSATSGIEPIKRCIIQLEVFFARRADLLRLLAEVKRRANVAEDRQIVELADRYGCRHTMLLPKRDQRTLCLPGGLFEGLERRVREFALGREHYERVGVPWRLGILLHGEPGTGKTSLAHALASTLGMKLCVIPLADVRSDEDLVSAFSMIREGSIVLIEDVDSAFRGRKSEEAQGITFSGFLNCIDGVLAAHNGRILIMTTNHIDRLDPALIRPGRADLRVEVPTLTLEAASDYVDRLFPQVPTRHEIVREVLAEAKPTAAMLLNRLLAEPWRPGAGRGTDAEGHRHRGDLQPRVLAAGRAKVRD